MLEKAAIKVSLQEPRAKFLEMVEFLKYFGTRNVQLVHVVNGSGGHALQKAEARMEELAGSVEELGFAPEVRVIRGHPATRIIDAAREDSADFICIYWMPKNLLRQALFGSIDSDVLRMSDVPVLVHNRKLLGGAPDELNSVLYPTNFKATDTAAMRYLTNKDFRARKLYILHAGDRAPDPYAEQERSEKSKRNLERLADECAEAYDEIETLDVIGRPRREVLRHAKSFDTDLIVIGKSDNPDPLENLLGSTAEAVAKKARRSVFIVPGAA